MKKSGGHIKKKKNRNKPYSGAASSDALPVSSARASASDSDGGGSAPVGNPLAMPVATQSLSGASPAGVMAAPAKVGWITFFRQVRAEMARVTWPTRNETIVTTIMVFIMVALAALFFLLADQILSFGLSTILGAR